MYSYQMLGDFWSPDSDLLLWIEREGKSIEA